MEQYFIPRYRRIWWTLLGILALCASLIGLIHPNIYVTIMIPTVMPGVLAQDMVAAVTASMLIVLVNWNKIHSYKVEILCVGIVWFLFYAYGVYVIERAYNSLYLVYMGIFGIAFYTAIEYLMKLPHKTITSITIKPGIRWMCIVFAWLIPLLFYPMWIGKLIPLMQAGEKIEFLYSIFIIDLCLVLPAYGIFGILAMKKDRRGLLALPFLLIFGFLLLFPVGIGEIFRPQYGEPGNYGDMLMYSGLASIFLGFGILYLKAVKID